MLNKRRALVAGILIVLLSPFLAWTIAAAQQPSPVDVPGRWAWGGGVPGQAFQPDWSSKAAVELSPTLVPDTVRRVVSTGEGKREYYLLAALSTGAEVCFSFSARVAAREFSCLNDAIKEHALIESGAGGGSTLGVPEWAHLLGIARSDVGRVVVTASDGSRHEVALNPWRAFSYEARARDLLPTALTAYGHDGSVIEHVEVTP